MRGGGTNLSVITVEQEYGFYSVERKHAVFRDNIDMT